VTVNTIAECLRTDCNILGDNKKKLYSLIFADLKVIKIKQWMEKMKNREQLRLVVEEAKAHPGL
jgi:hypothetical protein